MALQQGKYTARGRDYSPFGVEIRCLRPDQTTLRNTVHYLVDGNCTLRFSMQKQEFFVPVVVLLKVRRRPLHRTRLALTHLQAFRHTTDREIFEKLVQGDTTNTFLTDRVELLLREAAAQGSETQTQNQCLAYLGSKFRGKLRCSNRMSDKQVGELLIRRFVLVHLEDGVDKFNFLLYGPCIAPRQREQITDALQTHAAQALRSGRR